MSWSSMAIANHSPRAMARGFPEPVFCGRLWKAEFFLPGNRREMVVAGDQK